MAMHGIDWAIVALFFTGLMVLAVWTKRYTKSVADFLVANRCAGRYLLTISRGVAGTGAISFVALFEMFYRTGFTATWWWIMTMPISLFMTISGYIYYRYRETRAMTMAQFFQARYSPRLRVFCGILAWLTGIINMGIFPAVTARFFLYFCHLPPSFELFGLQISTFVVIMIIELSIALLFTFLGGMIVVVITDFLQGIFCNIAFLAIMVTLFFLFDWDQIVSAVRQAPENASMINPFKTTKAEGFSLVYFFMAAFVSIYGAGAWQGVQGYNAAAKNAHEAKMAAIIGIWREVIQVLLIMMLPICAFTLLHHGDFAAMAQDVQQSLNSIEDSQLQKQMTVPLALARMLPVGIMGLFAAVMLASAISTDDTYMHSWGSIFIQDVVLPFRKKGFTPKQHMWLLRASIAFVAVFIFCFSLLFRQNDFILMYMAMTGAIYMGGAGSLIVGGLYWKHGSTAGAWAAMIIGATLAAGGLILRIVWPDLVPVLRQWFPDSLYLINHTEEFPFNGMQINVFAMVCSITAYIIGSLWSSLVLRKPPHNMDRMLHRGKYAIQGEHAQGVTLPATGLKAILPTAEFSGWDKLLHLALTVWNIGWFSFFLIVTSCHLIWGTSERWWLGFWSFKIVLTVILGIATTIWFLVGGLRDFRDLFRALNAAVRNTLDDGRVANHHNLDDPPEQ